MSLNQIYNNENIFIRAVIAGVLNVLNNKLSYQQYWSSSDIDEIIIPWFYNFSGDERFMQDFYTFYGYCVPPKPVDGNFDVIPRGVITYKGSAIENTRITSRFVEGIYTKNENNILETYRSFLYYIPLNITFDAEIKVDNFTTALKLEQALNESFYKTYTFYIYYRGMRVACTIGFPESYTIEKNVQYSFESNNPIKLNLTFQIETYQPVFDKTTEVKNNKYMTGLGFRLMDGKQNKHDGDIIITSDYSGLMIPKTYPLLIEWQYKNENAILNKVDISWSLSGDNKRNLIARSVSNNEYFVWQIPEDFTNYNHPTITWNETSGIKISREPIVRIIPDPSTKLITESSFYILEPGYFINGSEDSSINVVLEMKDQYNNVTYTEDNDIYLNISNNCLLTDASVVVLPNGPILFTGEVYYKQIDLYVSNSVVGYERNLVGTDNEYSFGVIRNITIV